MKIGLAQLNPTVGDFAGNSARILDLACQAKQRGAELAVFSELCLCGYLPQDLLERPRSRERNRTDLACLAKRISLPAIVGYAGRAQDSTGKAAANNAALVADRRVVFEQSKMLLPTYDVFDESRYFQPAKSQHVFPFGGEQLGITICEDIWNDKNFWAKRLYECDPVAELVGKGATLLLNISASPYTIDKRNLRRAMLQSLARSHRRPIVYVNQVGGNDSLVFDGSSVALTADGPVAAQARIFEEDLVLFDTATGRGDVRTQPEDELEVAYYALVCGTHDYVCKCGFRQVLVGLSGGIGLAVVAGSPAAGGGPGNVLGVALPRTLSSVGSLGGGGRPAENTGIQFLVFAPH